MPLSLNQYNYDRWLKMRNWVHDQGDGLLIIVMCPCVIFRYKSIMIEVPEDF